MGLKGSKTEDNLKAAFAGESQANRRYLYFAQQADVEGYNDVAAVFRSTAEGETGHAHGHLEFLQSGGGDPATNMPIGDTASNGNTAFLNVLHLTVLMTGPSVPSRRGLCTGGCDGENAFLPSPPNASNRERRTCISPALRKS